MHTHWPPCIEAGSKKKKKKENKRLVDIEDECVRACVFACAHSRALVCVWVCLSVLEDEVGDYRNS